MLHVVSVHVQKRKNSEDHSTAEPPQRWQIPAALEVN